ncbi:MAG: hypothetical protein IKN57_02740 [Parasporobacterium sp.]|nr:hypothetical protein [Parasporobacterium sp.]
MQEYMTIICPNCGAHISIGFEDEVCHCEYCDQTMPVLSAMSMGDNKDVLKMWSEERMHKRKLQNDYEIQKLKLEYEKERYKEYSKNEKRKPASCMVRGCLTLIIIVIGMWVLLGHFWGIPFLLVLIIILYAGR